MVQMTYNEALEQIIENTEIGYTLDSQDRLWLCFIFDLWSEGERAPFRYNRLYPIGDPLKGRTAYDLTIDGVLVWTSRTEAETYADKWRKVIDDAERYEPFTEHEKPEVYVMNLGDDARYEATQIGRWGTPCRPTPKYKGSVRAWEAISEMRSRWVAEDATR